MAVELIQYWHDPEPPREVAEAFASFDRHNPGLSHRVFDRAQAENFIASHYSARELNAFRACAVPAMQADYLRYCAVLMLGGVYVDADFECLGDISRLADADGADGLLWGRTDPVPDRAAAALGPYRVGPYYALNNEVLAFRSPGHPLLELALELATANIEQRVADGAPGVWLTAGPGLFTSMYLAHRLGSLHAFVEYCEGRVLEASAPLFCGIVRDWERLERAFRGVRLRPRTDLGNWLKAYDLPLAPDGPEAHWKKAGSGIFSAPA